MAGDLAERACFRELCGRLRDDAARPAEKHDAQRHHYRLIDRGLHHPALSGISAISSVAGLYFAGAIFTILFAFPLFWLFDTKNALVIGATDAVAINFGQGLMFGPLSLRAA